MATTDPSTDDAEWNRREQAARIDKLIAETHKLVAESAKYPAGSIHSWRLQRSLPRSASRAFWGIER